MYMTETLDRIGPDVAKNVEDVKLSIKEVQDELGPKLVATNHRGIVIIAIVGVIAALAGGILSIIISKAITNPFHLSPTK